MERIAIVSKPTDFGNTGNYLANLIVFTPRDKKWVSIGVSTFQNNAPVDRNISIKAARELFTALDMALCEIDGEAWDEDEVAEATPVTCPWHVFNPVTGSDYGYFPSEHLAKHVVKAMGWLALVVIEEVE